jgi:hypothetical protein
MRPDIKTTPMSKSYNINITQLLESVFLSGTYKTTRNLLPKTYQSILYSVKPCPIRKREKKNISKTIKSL